MRCVVTSWPMSRPHAWSSTRGSRDADGKATLRRGTSVGRAVTSLSGAGSGLCRGLGDGTRRARKWWGCDGAGPGLGGVREHGPL